MVKFSGDEYGPGGLITLHAMHSQHGERITFEVIIRTAPADGEVLGDEVDRLRTETESAVVAFVALYLPLPRYDESDDPAEAEAINADAEGDRVSFAREFVAGVRMSVDAPSADFWPVAK